MDLHVSGACSQVAPLTIPRRLAKQLTGTARARQPATRPSIDWAFGVGGPDPWSPRREAESTVDRRLNNLRSTAPSTPSALLPPLLISFPFSSPSPQPPPPPFPRSARGLLPPPRAAPPAFLRRHDGRFSSGAISATGERCAAGRRCGGSVAPDPRRGGGAVAPWRRICGGAAPPSGSAEAPPPSGCFFYNLNKKNFYLNFFDVIFFN